jgi:hypothetical protein
MNNTGLVRWVGDAAVLIAGFVLMLGGAIAVAILFVGAFSVVLVRKLKPGRPALSAGA